MWVDHSLKCPNEGEWLAVIRVTDDGETELMTHLSDIPEDVERELEAVNQRWYQRWVWPHDQRIQDLCRIEEVDTSW